MLLLLLIATIVQLIKVKNRAAYFMCIILSNPHNDLLGSNYCSLFWEEADEIQTVA